MKGKVLILGILTGIVLMQVCFGQTLALNGSENNNTFVQSTNNKSEEKDQNGSTLNNQTDEERREELIDYRNETTKVFKDPDGIIRAEVSPKPIHFLKDGAWMDFDNTLIETVDDEYKNKRNKFEVSFPKNMEKNKGLLKYEIKGHKIEIRLNEQPIGKEKRNVYTGLVPSSAEIDKSKIKYSSIYPGVSFEYLVEGTKVKEKITLNSYQNMNTFEFFIKTNGKLECKEENGELIFKDSSSGEFLFKFEKPFMYDSNPQRSSFSYDLRQEISSVEDGFILTLEINEEYLKDPSRVYPIIIDPIINDVYNSGDTFISEFAPTTNHSNQQYLTIGGKNRGLIKWTLPNLANMEVKSASIGVAPAYWVIINYPINIHKVISPYDTNIVTWNSQPSFSNKIEGVISGVSYDQYNYFNITNLVKEWYLDPSKNYGLLLKMGDIEEINSNESYNFLSTEYVNNPLWSEIWVYPEPGPKLTIEFTPTLGINQYNYDTGGRLTSIFLASGGRINFEYDFNGNIKRRVYSPQ